MSKTSKIGAVSNEYTFKIFQVRMYVYAIFLKPNGNAIADDDYTNEFGRFVHFYGYIKTIWALSEALTILHRRRLCSAAPLARTDCQTFV